jgi:TolB-like protein/Tfp pilus assembly protein PilF
MHADDMSLATALSDRYLLEREVGVGGSATVYLARDLRNRRQVALKVLHRDIARTFGHERFQREIETTANLRHPNILPLFDSGEVDGTLYYVMPYVAGESLRAHMDRTGQFTIDEALAFIREIAGALEHAHARGLVHRDVKPENVLVENGRAVVTDFGIARAPAGMGAERLTSTGMSLGTPLYMSPEQAFGEGPVDARSDQYSLACVLYEMLAGQPPFTGTNAMAILVKHLQQPVPPITALRADVTTPIASAIERALSKEPGARYASIGEWVAALSSPAPAAGHAAAHAPSRASAHAATSQKLGITVVPFVATTTDDTLAAMADELTDNIAGGLSVFPYLTVVRGEESRAEYLLKGTLRRAGSTLRVAVQVVHRTTREQLWGDSYNRPLSDADMFAVADDVADHVIAVVADPYGVLVRRFTATASEKDADSLTPYEAVLLYYHYHQRPAPDTHLLARQALERAAEREPNNSDVWASLTYLYLDEDRHAFNPRPDPLARALSAARKATDADPTNANAHHALAEAHFFRGDLGGFRASAERAISLNRRDGATVAMLGNLLVASGTYEQGVELAQRAMACNPYHPGWYLFGTFFDQYRRGELAEALATAERINMPMYFMATLVLAVAHSELGHVREADAARAELRALMPTIEQDGAAVVAKWFRHDPTFGEAFLAGMARAGIIAPREGAAVAPVSAHIRGHSHSIAVLPFTSMSNDSDAEFLGDGIAEDILGELSKLSGLHVIAWTSSFALKGQRSDVRSIGTLLGAQYVLDGSIRKAGQRFRTNVQLVDAVSGHTLWTNRYDRDMTDVFAVQDEITMSVRDALSERLLGIAVPAKRAAPPIDTETYELYLRGKYLLARHLESPERGIGILEEVTRRAPRFAPALNQLATAHKLRVIYGTITPAEGWPLVQRLSARALEIDPDYAPAHFTLADAAFYWEYDWKEAESLFARALSLDPQEPDVLASYAMFKCSTRDFDAAQTLVDQAAAIDPLNPTVHLRAAIVQYLARRHDDVFAACNRMTELAPEFAEGYRWKGLSLLALGRFEEALTEFSRTVKLSGRSMWSVFDLGLALAACGRIDEARAIAAELTERSRTEPISDHVLILGPQLQNPPDLDCVFELLERAVRVQRAFWVVMFDVEPTLDWLRDDPRFTELLRLLGIPRLQR